MTSRDDVGADLVVLECERRGIALYRFNGEDFPILTGAHVDPAHGIVQLIERAGDSIEISQAHGIWIRRPQWPSHSGLVDEGDRVLALQESVATLAGAWRILADKCVSSADALQAARWKLPQLRLASQVGFTVPETIVTTDPERARQFLESGPSVIKPVAEARVRVGNVDRIGSVQAVNPAEPLSDVALVPTMFQRLVPKVADLRVTVVGSTPFAVLITTPAGAPIDFRDTDPDGCTYQPFKLAEADLLRAIKFMDHYGLRFGAFDFGVTSKGELVFFECNPSGQWGWIEARTEMPITAALVTLLLNPPTRE